MTTLSKDEIIAWARKAGLDLLDAEGYPLTAEYIHFTHLCRADLVAENEKLQRDLTAWKTMQMPTHLNALDGLRKLDAEVAELRAENERLKPWATQPAAQLGAELGKKLAEMEAELASLRSENERLASLAKEYRDNGDRLLDVADSLRTELSALRAEYVPCYSKSIVDMVKQEAVAWLKEWDSVGRAQTGLRRVDLKPECEPWLANMFPKVTPLYPHPQPSAVPVVRELVEALEAVEALIEHQYTGTRDGMNALQNAADDAHDALKTGQQWLKENTND